MQVIRRGFTLYELLLTLGLVAVLVSLGVPAFASMIARSRQAVEINALFHAFHVARKESIVHRQVVSLCPSADGQSCLPGKDWSPGWIVFRNEDRDSPPQVDPGEQLVQAHLVANSVRISANRSGFTLRATVKRATNGTLIVCDAGRRVRPKALVVSYTGRPRVALERPDGSAYSCAD